jgi:hypothetical protein
MLLMRVPGFDPSRYDPLECLAAAARCTRFIELRAPLLAKFPGLDLNMPLPHGVHGFPDTRQQHSRETKLSEGIPLIFSRHTPGYPTAESDSASEFDLNRRGKYGETLHFHDEASVPPVNEVDIDAHDRHGNTAVISAVLSRRQRAVQKCVQLACDLVIMNENDDRAWELANLRLRRRLRRSQEGAQPRRIAVPRSFRSKMEF